MAKRKYGKAISGIFLTSLLTLSVSIPELVLAQQSTVRVGLPGRRVGGGTRGDCNFGQKQLTALMPKNNLALTIAANPLVFFYIPPVTTQTVEFVLLDEAENQVYEKTFKPTGTNGIISLSLPSNAPLKELIIGKKYHWYLSVICNAEDRANDITVDGWIQRVEPNPTLTRELEKAAPLQRPAILAAANLWQDALVTLAQLRSSHPYDANIAFQWKQLLQSADLNNIAQEPVVALSK